MKKIICIVMLIIITICFCGCGSGDVFIEHEYSIMNEWVSPDGVHYWFSQEGVITPRFDRDGNLVVEPMEGED